MQNNKKVFKGIELKPVRQDKLFFEGETQHMWVYEIPLDKIFYNVANGRIGTYVNDYNLNNPTENLEDLMLTNIEEFNNQMEVLILNSDKSKRFEETKQNIKERSQQEPGVILSDGTILDGNRRYTSLRQLYRETSDAKFHKFEAMIIDKDDNNEVRKKSIKMLEIQLQHGKDEKVDYSPIQKLVDIYNNVYKKTGKNSLLSDEEYYKSANIRRNDYLKMKSKMEIMVDFCNYISMPEKFSIVDELTLDGPINEISNFQSRLIKGGDEELYKSKYKPLIYSILISHKDGDISRDLRDLFKSHKTGAMETLYDEEMDKIEHIYENLRNVPQGKEVNAIREMKSSDTSELLIKKFEDTIFFEKRKAKQMKSLDSINSAIKSIENIDSDQFKHMPDDELFMIQQGLVSLRELIINLTERINHE